MARKSDYGNYGIHTVNQVPALLLCCKGGIIMPRNQFQRMVFALLTVIVTVHAYVFYSLYVVNGNLLMNVTGSDFVLHAIDAQGGVYMFGRMLPIWAGICKTSNTTCGYDHRPVFCFAPARQRHGSLAERNQRLSVLWRMTIPPSRLMPCRGIFPPLFS